MTEGYRKKKNWFKPGMSTAQQIPINQARNVLTGIVGSSVFATAARTSGYGESSSGVIDEDCDPSFYTFEVRTEILLPKVKVRIVELGNGRDDMFC